jgi:Glyoxalase/Bleomycin resistance protein/Dioxygenase superfamily
MRTLTGTPGASGGAWVEASGSQIHLIRAERTEGRANPFGPHLAFEVEDFDEAKRTLAERSISFVEAPDGLPFRQLWLLDPSGNTVELWVVRDRPRRSASGRG